MAERLARLASSTVQESSSELDPVETLLVVRGLDLCCIGALPRALIGDNRRTGSSFWRSDTLLLWVWMMCTPNELSNSKTIILKPGQMS